MDYWSMRPHNVQQKQTVVKLKSSKCWKLVNLPDSEARGLRIFPTFKVFQLYYLHTLQVMTFLKKKLISIAYFCFYFFFLFFLFTSLHYWAHHFSCFKSEPFFTELNFSFPYGGNLILINSFVVPNHYVLGLPHQWVTAISVDWG